jgi:hypothetical protein
VGLRVGLNAVAKREIPIIAVFENRTLVVQDEA